MNCGANVIGCYFFDFSSIALEKSLQMYYNIFKIDIYVYFYGKQVIFI